MDNEKESDSPAAVTRREQRYNVPDSCQQYIKLRIKSGNEFVTAILGNFSRSGILFECPVSFSKGMHTECVISISLLLSREISFGIEVKYCYADKDSYIMGASIDTISDETWFDVFVEVHDFIVLRKGSV
ncbi:MAG TPA: PilZ domain-containing protein [Nitrospirota bacterium]|nr:PilZ domain-containing protein [Nitrospirota bacterium]